MFKNPLYTIGFGALIIALFVTSVLGAPMSVGAEKPATNTPKPAQATKAADKATEKAGDSTKDSPQWGLTPHAGGVSLGATKNANVPTTAPTLAPDINTVVVIASPIGDVVISLSPTPTYVSDTTNPGVTTTETPAPTYTPSTTPTLTFQEFHDSFWFSWNENPPPGGRQRTWPGGWCAVTGNGNLRPLTMDPSQQEHAWTQKLGKYYHRYSESGVEEMVYIEGGCSKHNWGIHYTGR